MQVIHENKNHRGSPQGLDGVILGGLNDWIHIFF